MSLLDPETAPERLRLFVAVPIPEDVKVRVAEILRKLQKGASFTGARPSWVRAEGVHQTLVFLGSQPAACADMVARAMQEAVAGMNAFALSLSGVRLFPNERNPRVVCMDLHGDLDALEQIQSRLSEACRAAGFEIENRPFKPHVTLGRIKTMRGVSGLAGVVRSHKNEKAGRFAISSIVLYRSILSSEGARYDIVHSQPIMA